MASLTKHPHWNVEEEEARELAKRTRAWLDSIDKAKMRKLEQKYGKYIPGAQLVIAVGVLTIPKVVATIDLNKKAAARVHLQETKTGNAPAPAPAPAPRPNANRNGAAPPSDSKPDVSLAARAGAGRWGGESPTQQDAASHSDVRPLRGADGAAFDFGAE